MTSSNYPGAGGSPPWSVPPQPQPWGQTPYGSGPAYRYGSGMAIAALVLGIIALITGITIIGGVILGLVAVILGIVASRRAKHGLAPGRGMAIAGIVTGAIGIVLAVGIIVLGVSIFNSRSGKTLQSCLNRAGSNQTEIQACQNQFAKNL